MRQMHLVTPAGKIYGGFEAAVRAVMTRPILGWLARAYYLPGLRQLLDAVYRWIASHRYRLMGKAIAAGECPGGACALHATVQRRLPFRLWARWPPWPCDFWRRRRVANPAMVRSWGLGRGNWATGPGSPAASQRAQLLRWQRTLPRRARREPAVSKKVAWW